MHVELSINRCQFITYWNKQTNKQLAQRYYKYAVKIQDHYLPHNSTFTKAYLTGLIKTSQGHTNPPTNSTSKTYFSADTATPILQLFTNWSFLNYSGYRYNILTTPNCPYCNIPETTDHFLLNCKVFHDNRSVLKHKLRPFTKKALFGLIPASRKQLIRIFLSLYDYIADTKRQKIGYSSKKHYWNKFLKKQHKI